MYKILLIYAFFLIISTIIFPTKIYAVTVSISNIPSLIPLTDEFTIDVTVSGASSGTNYLKIDLYKSDTSNYFGETFNGNEWYNGSDFTKYLPISVQSGTDWNGSVKGRVGNPSSSQFDGNGQYKLRIRRYTASGNYSSAEANNSALDIQISSPSPSENPSPTLTETESPSITPSPTDAVASPTNGESTPTPTPSPYSSVYISEAMVNPDTNNNEWVELYNNNDFVVHVIDWYIDDVADGGSSPKKISLTIDPKTYAVIDLTGSIFNNDEDSIRLLDSEGKEKDNLKYESSEKGKTLGRKNYETDDLCIQEPSKGVINKECLYRSPTESKQPTIMATPFPTKIIVSLPLSLKTPPKSIPTFFTSFSQLDHSSQSIPENNVLGIATKKADVSPQIYRAIASSLSLASFSYGFLIIFSVIAKLKRNRG